MKISVSSSELLYVCWSFMYWKKNLLRNLCRRGFTKQKMCLKIAIVLHFWWKTSVSNLSRTYNIFYEVQGEHKNTSCFQVVIKSKLTGIFL